MNETLRKKMNIVVLAGGLCPERDVSLSSGSQIANALIENGHNVLLADLYMGLPGADSYSDAYKTYSSGRYEFQVPAHEPDLQAIRDARANAAESRGGRRRDALGPVGEGILGVCADADITFNALHGDMGENGRLQALFDIYGVKYTGSGYEGSMMAMDKPLAKGIMRLNGIRTPDWRVYNTDAADRAEIINRLEFPCVIKPCGCGSSVGVSMVGDLNEFNAAFEYAGVYEKRVLIEPRIEGREFSVGVLGRETLPPIEIIPKRGFYDYKNKYQPGATLEVCPPENLSSGDENRLRGVAARLHEMLRLSDYSRTDMIMDASGAIYCLEINTLPGMTPTSLIPQEALAIGISYRQLCERIIALALDKYNDPHI